MCHDGIAIDQRRWSARSTGGAHSACSFKRTRLRSKWRGLVRTVHWMFDRGLISIGDDYKILVAKGHVHEDAARLLNQNGSINLPKDEALYPNAHYLKFHRDKVFKS